MNGCLVFLFMLVLAMFFMGGVFSIFALFFGLYKEPKVWVAAIGSNAVWIAMKVIMKKYNIDFAKPKPQIVQQKGSVSLPQNANDEDIALRIAYLVGHLRSFRKDASAHKQTEYSELREIGLQLHNRGGIELMRNIAKKMAPLVTAPPNKYSTGQIADSLSDINDYWDGIGQWQG